MKIYKEEYDKQVEDSATQINYNERMRKQKTPREGFIAPAVRQFYDILKHGNPKFTAAVKLAKRCHQNLRVH